MFSGGRWARSNRLKAKQVADCAGDCSSLIPVLGSLARLGGETRVKKPRQSSQFSLLSWGFVVFWRALGPIEPTQGEASGGRHWGLRLTHSSFGLLGRARRRSAIEKIPSKHPFQAKRDLESICAKFAGRILPTSPGRRRSKRTEFPQKCRAFCPPRRLLSSSLPRACCKQQPLQVTSTTRNATTTSTIRFGDLRRLPRRCAPCWAQSSAKSEEEDWEPSKAEVRSCLARTRRPVKSKADKYGLGALRLTMKLAVACDLAALLFAQAVRELANQGPRPSKHL